MMFSEHLRMFMELCVMTKRSCGACDGELDSNLVQPARRNFLLGVGTAVAAGLAPTAPAAEG
jgi:hypothetical protein